MKLVNIVFSTIVLAIVIMLLPGCRKSTVILNRTSQEILLQNVWKPTATWVYNPYSGKEKITISIVNLEFTSDGQINYWRNFTLPTNHIEYSYEKYRLLPDDSTLLIYAVFNDLPILKADTFYITKLTSHEMVYYLIHNKVIMGVDSLKRD